MHSTLKEKDSGHEEASHAGLSLDRSLNWRSLCLFIVRRSACTLVREELQMRLLKEAESNIRDNETYMPLGFDRLDLDTQLVPGIIGRS